MRSFGWLVDCVLACLFACSLVLSSIGSFPRLVVRLFGCVCCVCLFACVCKALLVVCAFVCLFARLIDWLFVCLVGCV